MHCDRSLLTLTLLIIFVTVAALRSKLDLTNFTELLVAMEITVLIIKQFFAFLCNETHLNNIHLE